MKTNAARILDQLNIQYEIRTYDVTDEEVNAVLTAGKIGLAPAHVYKTLVGRGETTGVVVASIPADAELDLKKFAQVSGNKRIELVAVKEIQGLTGYIRGGVSPLGMKKIYPYYLHENAIELTIVSVSAGKRGAQILLSGSDLLRATGAKPAALIRA
jgi:Cys-tRNA(Pro)/Cys-tRNA(Cys) deacylase